MEQPDELLAADGGSVRCPDQDQEWADLVGWWAGRIAQARGPDGEPYAAEVRLEFTRDAGVFVGRYSFTFERRAYLCTGPVRELGRGYFKFDAVSADGRMSNTFYFQITRAGDRITGRYVGFGPHSNRVVSGRASAKKTSPPADSASRPPSDCLTPQTPRAVDRVGVGQSGNAKCTRRTSGVGRDRVGR
jgi:hypothetical protein